MGLIASGVAFLLSAAAVASGKQPKLDALAGAPFPVITCFPDDPVRVMCPGGFPGITAEQCLDLGCCFSATLTYDWCFTASAAPSQGWTAYNGSVGRYAADQAIPAFASALGSGHVSPDGDVAATTCVSIPPLTSVCDNGATDGIGFPYRLAIGGELPAVGLSTQWFPYQVVRTAATVRGGIAVNTTVRMSSVSPAVLVSVSVGPWTGPDSPAVGALLPLIVREFPGDWSQWGRPSPPSNPAEYAASLVPAPRAAGGFVAISADRLSAAVTAAGLWTDAPTAAVVSWSSDVPLSGGAVAAVNISAAPSSGTGVLTIGFVFVLETNTTRAVETAENIAANFPAAWAAAQEAWESVWAAAFTPNNTVFAGHLPVVTAGAEAAAAIETVYYSSVISLLQLFRWGPAVHALQPDFPRFLAPTAGPEWAVTDTYVWDTSMAAVTLSLLDPPSMRSWLNGFLNMDLTSHYAFDFLSGTGNGPWYSFNQIAAFQAIDTFGIVSGGRSFYTSPIGGFPSALGALDSLATYFLTLNGNSSNLTDYGGNPANFLECVPTYIHVIPALNAANVYMLNRTAELYESLGVNASRATYFRALAAALTPQVQGLYVHPQGVWNCSYPAGHPPVTVRTVVDFVYCSAALFPVIAEDQAAEMSAFVATELRTPTWMRALSLRDAAANESDRDDHGPLGSYDGWPAMTVTGLSDLGQVGSASRTFHTVARLLRAHHFVELQDAAALQLITDVVPVLQEGPFGQAHHVYSNNSALGTWAIKGGRNSAQTYLESVGGAFSDAILRTVFQVGRGTRGGMGSQLRGAGSLVAAVRGSAKGTPRITSMDSGAFASLSGLRRSDGELIDIDAYWDP